MIRSTLKRYSFVLSGMSMLWSKNGLGCLYGFIIPSDLPIRITVASMGRACVFGRNAIENGYFAILKF